MAGDGNGRHCVLAAGVPLSCRGFSRLLRCYRGRCLEVQTRAVAECPVGRPASPPSSDRLSIASCRSAPLSSSVHISRSSSSNSPSASRSATAQSAVPLVGVVHLQVRSVRPLPQDAFCPDLDRQELLARLSSRSGRHLGVQLGAQGQVLSGGTGKDTPGSAGWSTVPKRPSLLLGWIGCSCGDIHGRGLDPLH